jgi:zearalenone synthase (highly reducing iterative type I polyketide synthase)
MELGFDAAGIVRRVGPAVSKFGIGDRVVMFSPGAHRTIHRAKADFCQSIPDGLTLEEAATIPLVHGTAWYALVPLARARGGQSILIHAAAGGVGQAAIQIAQHLGMEIFATVGSDVKRSLLRERYGIPDNQIFGSRGLAFADEVRRATSGRGVDVILNSLSGEALRQTWQCIAPSGCFIEIGARDILANARLDMAPFLRGATFTSFDLKRVAQESAEVMADIMQGVFDLQRKGITKPVTPIITFPAGEVENAFRLMQTGKHVGKIVLSFADDQIIPVVLDQRNHSPLNLDPAAAYVLAGGLGGLGRSLAGMLADNGARKLCFLSRTRSNASHPSAQELVLDLQSRGVQVLVQCCDVSSADAVRTAMDSCAEQLGAVRGVVQCAMVLRDTLFRNMGFADWAESMRPKVQGTWNLHRALPDVDFFVVLSSFTAIYGNRGQSNYAAGGAYQDAVAHFRRSRGLRGVTVDVSVVRDVGVVAEKGVTNTLRDLEIPYGLREREFVDLIRLAVAGDVAGSAPPQILTGLATGGSAVAGGFEVPWYLDDPKFSIMARTGVAEALEKGGAAGQQEGSVQARLSVAKNLDDAAVVVMGALVDRVAKMLQTTVGEIDTDRFLHSYGIDSLVAIEVVNWALKECEAKMTVFDVMATVPISATAKKIAANSSLLSKDLARG